MAKKRLINSKVSSDSNVDHEDIRFLRTFFRASGYITDDKEDDYRRDIIPDRSLIDTIIQFQRDHNLKPDGVINPDGPTEDAIERYSVKSHFFRCGRCGAPHGGVFSRVLCHNCFVK